MNIRLNQKRRDSSNNKGFTLIEVVLVLAIGGLIFLLAFLAFQQASINRRDTQRREDAARIVSELQNYMGDKIGGSAAPIPWVSLLYTGGGANAGVCTPSIYGALASLDFNNFAVNYLCQGGYFKSPSGNNYTTVAGSVSSVPSVDQIMYYTNTSLTSGSKTFCDGTPMSADVTAAPSQFVLKIGLEKGVVCKDSKS